MNNYSSLNLKSKAEYKDIKGVYFYPLREIKSELKYRKGDLRFWKWLWIIPLIPYKVREDLHKSRYWDGLKTLDKAVQDSWHNYCRIGDKVYEQAKVTVYHIAQNTEYLHFNSNEEAMRYVDDLKIRCKEVGNELK